MVVNATIPLQEKLVLLNPKPPMRSPMCDAVTKNRESKSTQPRIGHNPTSNIKDLNKLTREQLCKFWVDDLGAKDPSMMRITGTNINGIPTPEDIEDYVIGTTSMKSDIDCFQEVNLDLQHRELVRSMKVALQHQEGDKGSTFNFSTSQRLNKNGTWKMGGTLTHVRSKWTSQISKASDPHGRWNSVTMTGKRGKKLTVINGYRVNHSTIGEAGTDTVWMQEYESLLEQGVANPNPRLQFLHDMTDTTNSLLADGHEVVILMDANDTIYTPGES